jgi:HNH endonuclease
MRPGSADAQRPPEETGAPFPGPQSHFRMTWVRVAQWRQARRCPRDAHQMSDLRDLRCPAHLALQQPTYDYRVAEHRPAVPAETKRLLVEEAGDKCANPGCPTSRTHLHHIARWAVYESHDARDMIAVCPTCHDAVHAGRLRISDNMLRMWKRQSRLQRSTDVLYVEQALAPRLRLGSIYVEGQPGIIVFEPTPTTRLRLSVEGGDLALVSCGVAGRDGTELITITDNRVRYTCDGFSYDRRPGCFEFRGGVAGVLDPWMVASTRTRLPNFGNVDEIILGAEVTAPGEVTLRGIWSVDDRALVVRDEGWVVPRTADAAMMFQGTGTFRWAGPIDQAFFANGLRGIL